MSTDRFFENLTLFRLHRHDSNLVYLLLEKFRFFLRTASNFIFNFVPLLQKAILKS